MASSMAPSASTSDSPQAPASRVGVKGSVASAAASSSRRTASLALHPGDDGVAHAVGHGQLAVVLRGVVKRGLPDAVGPHAQQLQAQPLAQGLGHEEGVAAGGTFQPLRKAVRVGRRPTAAHQFKHVFGCQRRQHQHAAPACCPAAPAAGPRAALSSSGRSTWISRTALLELPARSRRCSAMKPSSARLASSARCQSSMHHGVEAAGRQLLPGGGAGFAEAALLVGRADALRTCAQFWQHVGQFQPHPVWQVGLRQRWPARLRSSG
jgi:hypothetical protein